MSKIQRVTIEFDDKVMTIEGNEAEKWEQHNIALASSASNRAGNQNPFDTDRINWQTEIKVNIPNSWSIKTEDDGEIKNHKQIIYAVRLASDNILFPPMSVDWFLRNGKMHDGEYLHFTTVEAREKWMNLNKQCKI